MEKTRLVLAEPESIDYLCDHIFDGGTLATWCALQGVKYRVVYEWIHSDEPRLDKYKKALSAREHAISDEVSVGLKQIATVDPRKAFDARGNLIAVSKLPDDVAGAIAGIDITTNERGDVTTKLRFDSRTKSLEMLGRSVGMFKERMELTGKDGTPLQAAESKMRSLSDEDLSEIERILTGGQKD